MPTDERSKYRRQFADAVRSRPQKIQIGARGQKIGPDWIAIDLHDKSPLIDHNWDLMDLPLADNMIDCFVCNAILEHVPHPELAVHEMHRSLRLGGQIWVEVPFMQFYHAHPHDFTRWTVAGLKILMSDFKEVASGIAEGAAYEVKKFLHHMNADAKLPVDDSLIQLGERYVSEREQKWKNNRFYSSVFFWGEKVSESSRPKSLYMDHLKRSRAPSPAESMSRVGAYRSPALHRNDKSALVSIVIPVFNQVKYTAACLKRVLENSPPGLFEIIVVDNHSTDGTAEFLSAYGDDIQVLTNKENLGFAAASNQGARKASGRFLLFLNNDVEVEAGWMEPLLERMESDPGTAAVGSQLLYPDGAVQHAGVVIIAQEGRCSLLPRHVFAGEDPRAVPVDQPMFLQMVTAACMLVRKEAFEAVGGFDEAFWNGCEDVDLCFKLRQSGGNIVYEPKSIAIHHESRSGIERQVAIPRNNAILRARWADIITPDILQEGREIRRNPDSPVRPCAGTEADAVAWLDEAARWWARAEAKRNEAHSRQPYSGDGASAAAGPGFGKAAHAERGASGDAAMVAALERKIAKLEREIAQLKTSTSWRITEPLRGTARGVTRLLRSTRRHCS